MSGIEDNQCVVGDLKNFSIFDITHTLMMSRKSALVTIQKGTKKGYLYFQNGQVISALDDDLNTGEKAAFKIFFWRGGQFRMEFDAPTQERNIKLDTENLLLEIARNMDEQQRDRTMVDDDSDASGVVETQFEDKFRTELHKVFKKVATNTTPTRDRYTVTAFDPLLVALNDLAGSALFLRPGSKPRIKTAAGFTTIKQETVAASEIEGFLSALFSTAESQTFDRDKEVTLYYSTEAAGTYAVRAFHDHGRPACIFSPASRSIPPLAHFGGAGELADLLARKEGLILLVGPLASGKTTLLSALLEDGLRRRDLLVTLFGKSQTYAFSEECGFIIRAGLGQFSLAHDGALQAAIEQGSDLIAVDEIADAAMFQDALTVATRASLVIGVLECEGAAEAAARLTEWCAGTDQSNCFRRLSQCLIEVVEVDLGAQAKGGTVIHRGIIDDPCRAMVRRGDLSGLGPKPVGAR